MCCALSGASEFCSSDADWYGYQFILNAVNNIIKGVGSSALEHAVLKDVLYSSKAQFAQAIPFLFLQKSPSDDPGIHYHRSILVEILLLASVIPDRQGFLGHFMLPVHAVVDPSRELAELLGAELLMLVVIAMNCCIALFADLLPPFNLGFAHLKIIVIKVVE